MNSAIERSLRISINVGGQEPVVFTVRKPTGREISKFLDARFTRKRNKVINRIYEARAEFARSILLDVENAGYEKPNGEKAPFNSQTQFSEEEKQYLSAILGEPMKDWRDLIPVNWLSSLAMRFEDQVEEGDDEEGN